MKAVILAGGEGRDLRPMTCDQPQPMLRLCGRPMLEYTLELLSAHGVRESVVLLRYLPERVEEHFEESRHFGMELTFLTDKDSRGTAGLLKKTASGFSEPFFVMSSETLADFDLSDILAFHKKSGAGITAAASRRTVYKPFGRVSLAENGRVEGYEESSRSAQMFYDAADTGIYVMDPDAVSFIPDGRQLDLETGLLSSLLHGGVSLFAYEDKGAWCRVSDIPSYCRCQQDMLSGGLDCRMPGIAAEGIYTEAGLPKGDYEILPPVYIGRGVHIGRHAVIGPYSAVDDGCSVGEGARVEKSIMLPCSSLENDGSLQGAVVCGQASVKSRAALFENAVAGTGAVISEGACLKPSVRVWPQKMVRAGSIQSRNIKRGGDEALLLDDGGVLGETGAQITPEFCARLGAAAGSAAQGGKLGVSCSAEHASAALKMAFTAGVISAGAQTLDFGRCFEALHNFAAGFSACTLGAYLSTGATGLVRFSVQGGLPLPRNLEREIERRTMREELSRCPWNEMSEPVNMPGVRFAYFKELLRLAPDGLAGMSAEVAGRGAAAHFLKETLQKSGCRKGEGSVTLALSPDGMLLNIIDETGAEVRRERVLALLCLLELQKGRDVAVPQEAPVCLDTMARGFGRLVLRYSSFSTEDGDHQARALAFAQPFVRDGLMASMIILSVLKKNQCTLHELMLSVPDFAQAETKMQVRENPSKYIHLLEKNPRFKKSVQGGILLEEGDGSVLVRPSGSGALRILAEAANLEIAEELCMRFDRLLKSGALDSIRSDGLK